MSKARRAGKLPANNRRAPGPLKVRPRDALSDCRSGKGLALLLLLLENQRDNQDNRADASDDETYEHGMPSLLGPVGLSPNQRRQFSHEALDCKKKMRRDRAIPVRNRVDTESAKETLCFRSSEHHLPSLAAASAAAT